ncbi:hypothetical protein K470DRAFT_221186 [Piedraia hortae CBS 480.64]|uniref:HIG1 domain-containing protein n=1 Tax=Piedraia hortae CBS 480.64 TaxID=1314780 RepID=A0A6A7BTU3_9PEZI|nr:hypothetical protein K470DRAFT_221186 [Piedraia hortae CBS 480.64]
MKILTKQEEEEHYRATVRGGVAGGLAGVTAGVLGVTLAGRRYPAVRSLTLPFRAFLVTSCGTFATIVSADRASSKYEQAKHKDRDYKDRQQSIMDQIAAGRTSTERTKEWFSENRYSIVFASWVASLGIAFSLVGRNPYLTTAQKLVQARVYAQGLTVAIVIISLALEGRDRATGSGRWETVKVLDPNDPTHKHLIERRIHHERYSGEDQWMDMVAAAEERMKARAEAVKAMRGHGKEDKKGGDGDKDDNEKDKKDKSSRKEKSEESDEKDKDNKESETPRIRSRKSANLP